MEDNEDSQMIIIDKVIKLIEKMADETRIDPYNMIEEVLREASKSEEFINTSSHIHTVDFVAFK